MMIPKQLLATASALVILSCLYPYDDNPADFPFEAGNYTLDISPGRYYNAGELATTGREGVARYEDFGARGRYKETGVRPVPFVREAYWYVSTSRTLWVRSEDTIFAIRVIDRITDTSFSLCSASFAICRDECEGSDYTYNDPDGNGCYGYPPDSSSESYWTLYVR